MMSFGFGEISGGLLHGLVIDKIGPRKTVLINVLIMMIMTVCAVLSVYELELGIYSILMCFTWGYNDGATNTFIYMILGFEFGDSSDPFAVWNCW